MLIKNKEIDNGFLYYNLDEKYLNHCYLCASTINNNELLSASFSKMYNLLNYEDFSKIVPYWEIKDISKVFCDNMIPFVTNLLIVLGYKAHQDNMIRKKLDAEQISIHKKRVRECFLNDLKTGLMSARTSQMLWAYYFIRVKIVEIGRLQYEYFKEENNASIKIHIPVNGKLNYNNVILSLKESKNYLKKLFNIDDDIDYICDSWLLSREVYNILSPNSNIKKFYNLFNVSPLSNCLEDILKYVYQCYECNDFSKLSEDTTLQREIKRMLISGVHFHSGRGILKKN